ncbi:MAG: molybdopterin synthase sulfur carrier subunit [Planctomycetota bacterium]|jgi:molybdopterin synthase sulfur carrier subunit
MIVHIPSPLRSYTADESRVEGKGGTIGALLNHLDRTYPGFRFRVIDEQDQIREHIRFFIGTTPVNELAAEIDDAPEVHIICAISGG